MTVKAVGIVVAVFDANGNAGLSISGKSADGSVDFTGGTNPTLSLQTINFNSSTLKKDIEAAMQTVLSAAPYSIPFATGDKALLLP